MHSLALFWVEATEKGQEETHEGVPSAWKREFRAIEE